MPLPDEHELRRALAVIDALAAHLRAAIPSRPAHSRGPRLPTFADDPILKRLHRALDQLYGDRIERAVLFGSRARGDGDKESDYDVAVF